jgi:hypothetical protein
VLEPSNIYVKLPGDVSDALYRVAARQWRHPREQALYFIAEGLRQLGELPDRELTQKLPATLSPH